MRLTSGCVELCIGDDCEWGRGVQADEEGLRVWKERGWRGGGKWRKVCWFQAVPTNVSGTIYVHLCRIQSCGSNNQLRKLLQKIRTTEGKGYNAPGSSHSIVHKLTNDFAGVIIEIPNSTNFKIPSRSLLQSSTTFTWKEVWECLYLDKSAREKL